MATDNTKPSAEHVKMEMNHSEAWKVCRETRESRATPGDDETA